MFPLNIFLNNKYEKGDLKVLKVPLGIDPYKFEISVDNNHMEYLSNVKKMTKNKMQMAKELFCYYCGEPASNIIPTFLHNGSVIILWIYTDWRCHTVLCNSCNTYSKKNNMYYNRKFEEIKPGNPFKLLTFEPDILLPSLEPAYKHFEYHENGQLFALTERGKNTIDRFGLNRDSLANKRQIAIQNCIDNNHVEIEFMSSLNMLFCLKKKNRITNVPDSHLLARYLHKKMNFYADEREITSLSEVKHSSITFQKIDKKRHTNIQMNFPGLNSIKFSGIRGFESNQSIEFSGKNSLIILGENGVGKSTLLQLIKKCTKPYVKVELRSLVSYHGTSSAAELDPFVEVIYNDANFQNFIYHERNNETQGKKKLCNLIDIPETRISTEKIKNLRDWLVLISKFEADYNDVLNWIERKLKILLDLDQSYKLDFYNGNPFWKSDDQKLETKYLDQLSSGYVSLMTIFHLIVVKFINNNSNNLNNMIKGFNNTIVLIDEIELHLHPVFKKRVIDRLEEIFPEILFIITTHDPLVLNSKNENMQVVVLKKIKNSTVILKNLPNPNEMSTEQILTSPIFGLSSFDSSEKKEKDLNNYYQAIRDKNYKEINKLRKKLTRSGLFGNTYRELIAFMAVDKYLANNSIPRLDDIVQFIEKAPQ